MTTSKNLRPGSGARLLQILALAGLYVLTGRVGLSLAELHKSVTLIWPPTGLSLAALILYGPRLWPGVFSGALLLNLWMGVELPAALGIAVGNTLESLVAALLLKRVAGFRPSLERSRDVLAFLGIGAISCTAIAATFGYFSLQLTGQIELGDSSRVWLVWWLGDMAGAVVLTPVLLLARSGQPGWAVLLRRKEAGIVGAGLALACFVTFSGVTAGQYSLLAAFLPYPFLIWAGSRLGSRGAIIASGLTATVATFGTSLGHGPFVVENVLASQLRLVAYAMTMGTSALTLASAISQRERAEQQRQAAHKKRLRLERKMNEAQRLESLGLLACGIAHDFNNILTTIRGNSELLESKVTNDSDALSMVDSIVCASDRAADLCQRLLDSAGCRKPAMQSIVLADLLLETLALLKPSISKMVTLEARVDDRQAAVEGDRTLLGQVLMNLMQNGAEAVGQEPGSVVCCSGSLELDEQDLQAISHPLEAKPGPYGFLEVSDSGVGLASETATRMFDPFFSTKFEGRGLGLAAVLGIMNSHDGAINVRSEPGRGTCIRVYLPAASAPLDPDLLPRRAADPPRHLERGRYVVLVADDEPEIRQLVQRMLETAGFKVLVAADGQEALEAYHIHQHSIDLLLLDVTMPRMGGIDVLHEIRGMGHVVPVILMTGQQLEDSFEIAASDALLGKPFTRKQLLANVDLALVSPVHQLGLS